MCNFEEEGIEGKHQEEQLEDPREHLLLGRRLCRGQGHSMEGRST